VFRKLSDALVEISNDLVVRSGNGQPIRSAGDISVLVMMSDDARYEAMLARDPRFDGVFFVGVETTGVYCRPICPARTPQRSRCSFFASPVQAEAAGFRACFRCRPEIAPGIGYASERELEVPDTLVHRTPDTRDARRTPDTRDARRTPDTRDARRVIDTAPDTSRTRRVNGKPSAAPVDAVDTLVAVATQRITEGALNDASIDALAAELGVTARHLRRATEARLGVSPVELAQSRRLALAKQLLQDTALPVTDIAFAAGFGSVRRFNAVFAARMGTAPSELRRKAPGGTADALTLRLDYRPPYDWARLLAFLRARAIPGVEAVGASSYRRVVHLRGHVGEIEVRPVRDRSALELVLAPALLAVVMPLVARVRRMFDLDARPDLIDRALGRDRALAPMVAARPGLRLPGAIDPFEAAIRAMLGQQVSVAAATTLAGRFAAQLGARVATGDELAYRFPTPDEVAAAGAERIVKIGMPMTRATAIDTLARAVATGAIKLDATCDLDAFVAALVELPGIGPWTAHYLAMRALHLPDAFPASDLGIQKAIRRPGPKRAEARADAWRPYRSYAVMHLWTQLGETT
jgi:AraC family transcriptional regulator of adaptative response / DNA-3-methyladenine glycosylase II